MEKSGGPVRALLTAGTRGIGTTVALREAGHEATVEAQVNTGLKVRM